MLALSIPDTRDFMKKLFTEDVFDTFLVSEASLVTFTNFRIDGSWHPDYFDDDDEKRNALTWALLRPLFFGLIRGKHTPSSFRIIFRLADYNVSSLLEQSGLDIRADDLAGLFLNISYAGGEAVITSGSSMKIFTLDKRIDHIWDDMVLKFMKSRQIPYIRK